MAPKASVRFLIATLTCVAPLAYVTTFIGRSGEEEDIGRGKGGGERAVEEVRRRKRRRIIFRTKNCRLPSYL